MVAVVRVGQPWRSTRVQPAPPPHPPGQVHAPHTSGVASMSAAWGSACTSGSFAPATSSRPTCAGGGQGAWAQARRAHGSMRARLAALALTPLPPPSPRPHPRPSTHLPPQRGRPREALRQCHGHARRHGPRGARVPLPLAARGQVGRGAGGGLLGSGRGQRLRPGLRWGGGGRACVRVCGTGSHDSIPLLGCPLALNTLHNTTTTTHLQPVHFELAHQQQQLHRLLGGHAAGAPHGVGALGRGGPACARVRVHVCVCMLALPHPALASPAAPAAGAQLPRTHRHAPPRAHLSPISTSTSSAAAALSGSSPCSQPLLAR